jgi:hypothetical protein
VIDASARVVGDEAAEGAVAVAEIEDVPTPEPVAGAEVAVETAQPIVTAAEPQATAVEPAVDVTPSMADAPAPTAEPAAAQADPAAADASQKYPFSEAARAARLAQDLGIQLPKEGALTRQWIDFLNQLAAK